MAVDQLNVKLNLDAEEFADGLKSAVSLIKKLDNAIEEADDGIRKNRGVIRAWGKAIRSSLTELYSLNQLLTPIKDNVGFVVNAFIRANAEFEKTTAILSGLSSGVESTEQATATLNDEIARLEQLAKTTPFTMQALQNSMVKLKAGGVDDLAFSMQALIDSVASFGGSANELDRASIAIQQMAGKGVVSMEELRQQLGEAVPNAMALMARGLNVSMGELATLVESGTLEATGALQAMFTQMALENSGAAEDMMDLWDGIMAQISARTNEILREMGQTGLFEELKKQAQSFLDFLNEPSTLQFFTEMAESMTVAIQKTVEFIKYVDRLNVVMDILRDLLVIAALNKFVSSLTSIGKAVRAVVFGMDDMIAAVKNVNAPLKTMRTELDKNKRLTMASLEQFGFYNASLIKSASAAKRNKIVLTGLNATMKNAASLLGVVGRSALAFAGPIGAAVAIVIELAQAFDLFGDKIDEVREKAADQTMAITAEEYTLLAKNVSDSKEQIIGLNKELEKQNNIIKESPVGSRTRDQAAMYRADLQSRIAQIQSEITEGEAALESQNNLLATRAADSFTQAFDAAFDSVGRELKLDYNKALKEIDTVRDNPGVLAGQALQNELDKMKKAADETFIARRTAAAKAAADELYIARKAQIEEAQIDETARANKLRGLDIAYQEQLQEIVAWEKKLSTETTKVREEGIQQLDKSSDFWDKAYRKSFLELSGWMAKLGGENVNYAKSLAKVQLEKNKDVSYTREQAEAVANQVENIKANIAANNELVSVSKKIAKEEAKIAASQQKVEETNPWLKVTSAQKTYIALIEQSEIRTKRMAEQFGLASDKAKQAAQQTQEFRDLLSAQEGIDLTQMTRSLEDQTDTLQKQILTETQLKEVRRAEYQEQRGYINALIDDVDLISAKTGIAKDQLIGTFEAYGTALDQNFIAKNRTAVESLLVNWGDTTKAMDDMWASTMTNFTTALSDFVLTGKLDFESLTQSILKNMLQISIQAAASSLFSGAGSWFGGLFGTAGAEGAAAAGASSVQTFAKGGIAKARNPQLAVFGEGSQNEAFVPLPDGRSIPVSMNGQSTPNVSVNVINQTGVNASAEQQGQARFDGEKYILDVVMKAMDRPGNFRTAMKGNTRQ